MIYTLFKCLWGYTNLCYYITYFTITKKSIHNDTYYSHELKRSIQLCGCMAIKMVQWLLPKYNLIHGDTILYNTLIDLYDNCIEHSLEHTEETFSNDFNIDMSVNYEIIELIGSGSIGQVYKVRNKVNNKYFAVKVLHPNIEVEFFIFIYFMRILLVLFDYSDYIPIDDINVFMKSLYQQVDLRIEGTHMKLFKSIYNNSCIINIPTHYRSTKNILIMDYLEGSVHNSNEYNKYGIYNKNKLVLYLSIFSLNSALNNRLHGDLHIGNWNVNTITNTINIFDFGYCYEITTEEFTIIEKLINNPFSTKQLDIFLFYYLSKKYNSKLDPIYIYSRYKEEIHALFTGADKLQTQNVISKLFIFCLKNKVLLSNICLNSILVFLQLISIYEKTGFLSNHSKLTKINNTIIDICHAYDICPLLKEYLEEGLDKESVLGNFNNLNKYNNLKKYL